MANMKINHTSVKSSGKATGSLEGSSVLIRFGNSLAEMGRVLNGWIKTSHRASVLSGTMIQNQALSTPLLKQ